MLTTLLLKCIQGSLLPVHLARHHDSMSSVTPSLALSDVASYKALPTSSPSNAFVKPSGLSLHTGFAGGSGSDVLEAVAVGAVEVGIAVEVGTAELEVA